jgi:hypothetical protein
MLPGTGRERSVYLAGKMNPPAVYLAGKMNPPAT